MENIELMPWFSPTLSPAIVRVIHNLGHRSVLTKGEEVSVSQFFNRLVFVKTGFIAQAVLDPKQSIPFCMTLAGEGCFASSSHYVTSEDSISRRYWAATNCEILTVFPQILFRLSEVEKGWAQELNSYAVRRTVSERLGMMISHVAGNERRFGVFLVALLYSSRHNFTKELESNGTWVRLPVMPSRKLIATVISCSCGTLDKIIHGWVRDGVFMHAQGGLWMKRGALLEQWRWLKPFIQMQKEIEAAVRIPTPSERVKELDLFKDL